MSAGRRSLAALGLGCCLLAALGCGSHQGPATALRASDYPGRLVDPAQIPGDFLWQQSITATYRKPDGSEGQQRFDAVVQKTAGVLSVVGLTPFGTRAFVLEQRGQDVSLRRFISGALPIPARFVLVDIHRTYFVPADDPAAAARSGEFLSQRLESGGVSERVFRRRDGTPAGDIRIRYTPALSQAPGRTGPPRRITLDNGWFGYRLVIETLQHTPLATGSPGAN